MNDFATWTLVRVTALYAVPALVVIVAVIVFVLLSRQVRSGRLDSRRACVRYAWTVVPLPVAAISALWVIALWGSYLVTGTLFGDGSIALDAWLGLLPLAAALYGVIALLIIGFIASARASAAKHGR